MSRRSSASTATCSGGAPARAMSIRWRPQVLEQERIAGPGAVECAAWLSPSCLLLTGSFGGAVDAHEATVNLEDGSSEPAAARTFELGTPEEGGATLVALVMPAGMHERGRRFTLELKTAGGNRTVSERDLGRVTSDLPSLLRERFAPLDAGVRNDLLEFLTLTLAAVPLSEHHDLSERLYGVRQALRERLPAMSISQARRRGLHVDRVMAVDERSFFVEG